MLNTLDLALLLLATLFISDGWRKGFLRVLAGPVSLFICSFLGKIYFDITGSIFKSLLIAILGTILFSVVTKALLLPGYQHIQKQYRHDMFVGSRLLGGSLSLVWKGGFTLILLFLSTLLPASILKLNPIHKSITQSMAYSLVSKHIVSKNSSLKNILKTLSAFKNPNYIKKLSSYENFQKLRLNKKIQAITSDKRITEQLRKKNIAGLMTNPKIMTLMKDDGLMLEILMLHKENLLGGRR